MKISIVIATYNAAEFLATCLDSCVVQTWQDKEIVIIDGGSQDGTVSIIRRYAGQIAYWESKPDMGIYDAWNKALDHISGDWVLFRGADDIFWEPTSLEHVVPHLASASRNELVVYGTVVVCDEDGMVRRINGRPWQQTKRDLFEEMTIPHPGTFHHAELFRRFGKFDTSLRLSGDYEFLLRAFRNPDIEGKFIPTLIITKMLGDDRFDSRLFRSPYEAILARRRNHIRGVSWLLFWRLTANIGFFAARKILAAVLGHRRTKAFYRRRHKAESDRLWNSEEILRTNRTLANEECTDESTWTARGQ